MTTYIFCFIVLQPLSSAITARGIHARYVGEIIRKLFMDNFNLVLFNKPTLYPPVLCTR